jgi:hypothetical protein
MALRATKNAAAHSRAVELALPLVTYLITFSCYGCHLHGSESGSVDREHSARGAPIPKQI